MDLTQVKCFLILSETLSFSKTADKLFISQSTVSKKIKQLEEELQVTLFDREHRQIKLTPTGRYFYEGMLKNYNQATNLINSLKDYEKQEKVRVKLGYSNIPFEEYWIPLFLKMIKGMKIDLSINFLNLNSSPDMKKMLKDHEEDLILFQEDYFANDSEIGFIPLINKGYSLIAKKDDPIALNSFVDLEQLKAKNLIVWDMEPSLPSVSRLTSLINKKAPRSRIKKVSDSGIILTLVRSDLGYGLVNSTLYNRNDNDLSYIPVDTGIKMNYGFAYLKNTKSKQVIDRLIPMAQNAITLVKNAW